MPRKKLDKTLKQTCNEKSRQEQAKKEKCTPKIRTKKVTNPKGSDDIDVLVHSRVVRLSKRDIDFMLANEVVRKQFPKTTPLISDPSGQLIVDKVNQLNNKPVLNNKPTLKRRILKKLVPTESKATQEKTAKVGRPRSVRKKFPDSIEDNKNLLVTVNGTLEDQNEQQPKKSNKQGNKRSVQKQKQDPVENVETEATSEENVKGANSKIITKRKLPLNRKITTDRPRTRKQSIISKEKKETEEIMPDHVNSSPTATNKVVEVLKVHKDQEVVDVRRTSLASSELSWTKDISSSSATTCVTVSSKDFVRIDKKLPIIKLMNINIKLENDNVCDANETCEVQTSVLRCKENSFCEDSANNTNFENNVDSLPVQTNISSSTSISCADQEIPPQNVPVNKFCNILEKLSSKLKHFDLEIINWIGSKNENTNNKVVELQEKLFHDNFLKEEMNVIRHCRSIKETLSYNQKANNSQFQNDNIKTVCDKDVSNQLHKSNTNDNENNRDKEYLEKKIKTVQNDHIKEKHISHCKQTETNAPNLSKHATTDEDEDDALSLYAESLTGIDTSTRNSVIDKEVQNPKFEEEYIPEPITITPSVSRNTIIYEPTKINPLPQDSEDVVQVAVCEKQSADSTSIHKDIDTDETVNNSDVIFEDRVGDFDKDQTTRDSINKLITKERVLMADIYNPLPGVAKSNIFKNICIYNLNMNCRKILCTYSHKPLEATEMLKQLKTLNDETIVQEYMLIRSWAVLRRIYGMCFVEECIRRKLTRILVEIALDFVTKTKENMIHDCAVRLEVVEMILLYMNDVELTVCEDLLKCNIKSGVLLCDYFMSTIAVSQNFSRFKSVFINLTNFISNIGRSFTIDVAMHVLERIVILPYDEGLALALMKIFRKTDDSIFTNTMIGHLERQWQSSNNKLYQELRFIKDLSLKTQSVLGNCYGSSPHMDKDLDKYNKNTRYSPDTTNLDTLNKTTVEPKFTRTIDFNKLKFLHDDTLNLSQNEFIEKKNHSKPQFHKWRGKTVYNNIINRTHMTPMMRPPLRPPMKRRSDYSFGGSPNKFQRRNGPNFF